MNNPRANRDTRRSKGRGFRLAANVMEEESWDTDSSPNMRLSRAFVVVLILHIVAVGGLLAFKHFNRDRGTAANAPKAVVPAIPTKAPLPEIVKPAPPAEATAVVKIEADTLLSVFAEQRQVSEQKLRELNRDLPRTLFKGMQVTVPANAALVKSTADLPSAPKVNVAPVITPPRPNTAPAVVVTPPASIPSEKPSLPPRPTPIVNARPDFADTRPIEPAILERESEPVRQRPKRVEQSRPRERERERPSPPKVVKKPESNPAKPKVVAQKPNASSGARSHRVTTGDNLFRLAKRYGVSESAIMRANGIKDATKVPVGKVLNIPGR